jgi:hypothetical protein
VGLGCPPRPVVFPAAREGVGCRGQVAGLAGAHGQGRPRGGGGEPLVRTSIRSVGIWAAGQDGLLVQYLGRSGPSKEMWVLMLASPRR